MLEHRLTFMFHVKTFQTLTNFRNMEIDDGELDDDDEDPEDDPDVQDITWF